MWAEEAYFSIYQYVDIIWMKNNIKDANVFMLVGLLLNQVKTTKGIEIKIGTGVDYGL